MVMSSMDPHMISETRVWVDRVKYGVIEVQFGSIGVCLDI
jgi:hypothetical protein